MLVSCPKCKARLKIADEKIAPGGTRFKCPKCATVLLVKKPAPAVSVKPLDKKKVIVAHADPEILKRAEGILSSAGYSVITSSDGVDMMVKTQKELPGTALIDVALPKIYGFEICKRLRARPETKQMRLVLISSIYDKRRYRREPVSLYGADDYIDEHEIEEKLIQKVKGESAPETQPKQTAMPSPEATPSKPVETAPQKPIEAAPPKPAEAVPPKPAEAVPPKPVEAVPPKPVEAVPPKPVEAVPPEVDVEKARRLVRAILSDIYLYSAQKVEEAIRAGKFYEAFATELKEGMKLYEQRIPAETKKKGDFFKEEIEKFIVTRKKSLGLA